MAPILYKWLLAFSWGLFLQPASYASNSTGVPQGREISVIKNNGPSLTGRFHPFYISVTEINQNAKDHTLEISCKVFADDIEQILEKNYKTTLDISEAKDKARFDQLLPDYFGKHLSLIVDGKPVQLQYVGYEKDKEAAYCYFQVNNVTSLKKLDISNSILYDFNEEEINIMHVVVNGKRQSTKVNYPDKQASFSF